MVAGTLGLRDSCPICESTAISRLWEVQGHPIAKCGQCSLVFVQEIFTAEQLARHYASGRDPVYADDNRECLEYYYQELRKRIEARFPAGGKIFDVGCSGGWFLEVMKGWECYGCEIAPADAEDARRKFGDRIFNGTLEDCPSPDDSFDVITLQDVFDHCSDPYAVLDKCRRMLKPGGLLVIKVHNISCLYARIAGPSFYAVLPPSHLFYYNRQTLALAAHNAGFELNETRFIGHRLKISTVFHRLARSNSKSIFTRIYSLLRGTALGQVTIRKNLRDIITVFAEKQGVATVEVAPVESELTATR